MASLTLDAPTLYADHHVLKVREALLALDGVEDVYASSAWHAVRITYDETQTTQDEIEAALAECTVPGTLGTGLEAKLPLMVELGSHFRDPAWDVGLRLSQAPSRK